MKRDLLTIWDLSDNEIRSIVDRALELKRGQDRNKCPLMGKSIGLLFEKASTRTRVSFETGIYQLGAQALYMNASELQMGRGETIADTARTLSRFSTCDGNSFWKRQRPSPGSFHMETRFGRSSASRCDWWIPSSAGVGRMRMTTRFSPRTTRQTLPSPSTRS